MDQIPATEALGCRRVPMRRLRKTSVVVVGHTYRVIYITSPSQNVKNLEILPRSRPPGTKTLPLSEEMDQIPTTEALGCRRVSMRRLRKTSVIVVGHTYRVIYITSPSQNVKNLEILLRLRTPGTKTFPFIVLLVGQAPLLTFDQLSQSSPGDIQSRRYEFNQVVAFAW